MGVGEIAGLIAAIAFAILAGFMIYPLIRLGNCSTSSPRQSKKREIMRFLRLMRV